MLLSRAHLFSPMLMSAELKENFPFISSSWLSQRDPSLRCNQGQKPNDKDNFSDRCACSQVENRSDAVFTDYNGSNWKELRREWRRWNDTKSASLHSRLANQCVHFVVCLGGPSDECSHRHYTLHWSSSDDGVRSSGYEKSRRPGQLFSDTHQPSPRLAFR